MGLRTNEFHAKQPVADCITKRAKALGNTDVLYFCPGNATQYTVMTTEMTNDQCSMFGYGDGCKMVTVKHYFPERYVSLPMYTDGRPIFLREIEEVLGFDSEADARVITELLGHLLGSPTDVKDDK